MSAYSRAWIEARIEEIEARVGRWLASPSWASAPVLQTFAGNNMYTDVRASEASFANQMACIETTLRAKTDWMPFLEPWHGVGVYANLFGCEYDWTVGDYPQTRYAVTTVDEARRITMPDWLDGEICRLEMITDAIIEFSLAQLEAIGPNPARPGHSACLSRSRGRMAGIGLSDDLATVVSPAVCEEFSRPYNERIASALGGVVVHSCGVWRPPIMEAVLATKGLAGVELALSVDDDPSPSSPEVVRDGFAGRGIPVKARVGRDFLGVVEGVYHPDLAFIPQIAWDDDPAVVDHNYETLHARMAALGAT